MNHKSLLGLVIGTLFAFGMAVSNLWADEIIWLNPYKFIGEQNVKVSHGSPDYPGSIIIDIITDEEPVEPPAVPIEAVNTETVAEIIKRINVEENTAVSSITICFRGFEATLPFAINIYQQGLPSETLPITVELDELLGGSEFAEAAEECTTITIDDVIEPENDSLLLGILFDIENAESETAGIISAVGVGVTSTFLVIDECDTGIPDFDINGQPLSELIDECAENARNHGKFVSCVAKLTNQLKKGGLITGREKGRVMSCAAKASIP